ncbi:YgdI/YgdR family lipoprotein [Erwinia sp. MMLR14_017]|uniref:YgdI/YgdR family lipoprotein n=1 Tax=Erwinia sp. MMLR14_017 TaxID=3093842 RepID=UPI00298FF636|nr:YgdI/YgdR family lipoprotein [Erwinia sp. MMLR14_017]MDW8848000.1 YgdI/YgdR family lipoprotein [Erwinia sp. MMLR14_017]
MKRIIASTAVAFAVLTMAACSSDYVMQTKHGEMIVTKGKPETDKSTGLVTYKDAGGNVHEVNRDQIQSIIEK